MKCSPLRWLCVWHISLLCWAAVRVNNAPVNIVLTLTPVTQPVTYQAPSYWQAPGSPPVMGDPPTHTEMVPTGQTTLSAQYGGDDPIPEFVLNVFAPTVAQVGLGELTGLGLGKFLKCLPKLAQADAIANPVPSTLARVIPGEGPFATLGPPGNADVFVTSPAAIEGMTPAQISQQLGIQPSGTYTVIQFPTPAQGLA